jgi:hypothetical protein
MLTENHIATMHLLIISTLLLAYVLSASKSYAHIKISSIPRCTIRSATGKLAHAFDPVIGALVVCTYDKQDCYSTDGTHREPSKFTRTQCDIAFTACVAVNGVNRVNHANFRACLYGS